MSRIGYVVKVYPRFSETFVVTEILAREAQGDDLVIYPLRPTTDSRFHPEIARVKADVRWIPRPLREEDLWLQLSRGLLDDQLRARFAEIFPLIAALPGDEVAQGLALAQAVGRDGITHLHAHFASLAGRITWIAHQLTGVPYTVTTHAKDIYHDSVDPLWLKRICTAARRVIAISAFNQAHLASVLQGTEANITLCRNALELSRFNYCDPEPGNGPLRVLAVGRLVAKKGFADLISAAQAAWNGGVALEVFIAGEGELVDELQTQIAAVGMGERITLLGPKTQAEVCELMNQADVFVAPCIPAADGNIDGLPTVVLEAMAIGVPVIATAVTGLPEVIIDGVTGVLINPGDVTALSAALADFAAGRLPAVDMARQARKKIEDEYDSAKQAARLSAWENESEE